MVVIGEQKKVLHTSTVTSNVSLFGEAIMDWVVLTMMGFFVLGCMLFVVDFYLRRPKPDKETSDIAKDSNDSFSQVKEVVEEEFQKDSQDVSEALDGEDPEDDIANLVNRRRRRQ